MDLSPVQHLLAWLTPARRQLINRSAVDRLARRPQGSFSRFLAGQESATFERTDLRAYYPTLQLVGYLPAGDVWVPERPLSAAETSSDIREWFTPERQQLINLRRVDEQSKRPYGILSRYLNYEQHLSFKIIGIEVYYPTLQLLGFQPPAKDMNTSSDFTAAAEHLLTWFTPARRRFINTLNLDLAASQPAGTLSELLAGFSPARKHLAKVGLQGYYQQLEVFGYRPDLDLSQDASVQQHQATLSNPAN